jgi:hypothetical protein
LRQALVRARASVREWAQAWAPVSVRESVPERVRVLARVLVPVWAMARSCALHTRPFRLPWR